jgi:hypothetical protein
MAWCRPATAQKRQLAAKAEDRQFAASCSLVAGVLAEAEAPTSFWHRDGEFVVVHGRISLLRTNYPLLCRLLTTSMAIHFIHNAAVTTLSIDFHWSKDASGYRLVKKGTLPGGKPPGDRIVPNGGDRVAIRPMETPDLYMIFAYVDSAEKLLEFVERFGLLGNYEGVDYEVGGYYQDPIDGTELIYADAYEGLPVSKYVEQAAIFLEALRRKAEGPEQLAAFLKSSGALRQSLGDLHLIPDRALGARFQITPGDLMQALWFQLGQALASNIKLSTCLQCGQLFEVGVGSGRRADAKFCSDEHRTLYHSLNRKPARRS